MIIELKRTPELLKHGRMMAQDAERNELIDIVNWVCKAREGTSTMRDVLQLMDVRDNRLACTNGKRLHMSKALPAVAPFENGCCYRVLKLGSTVWMDKSGTPGTSYPDYVQVVPKDGRSLKFDVQHPESYLYKLCCAVNSHMENGLVNIDYLEQAVPVCARKSDIMLWVASNIDPLKIEHALGTAVLMPMRQGG